MYQDGQVSGQMPGEGRKRRSARYQQAVPDRVTDAAGAAYPDRRRSFPPKAEASAYADIADQSYDMAGCAPNVQETAVYSAKAAAPSDPKKIRKQKQDIPPVAAESVVSLKKTLAEKRGRAQAAPIPRKSAAKPEARAAKPAVQAPSMTQNGWYPPPPEKSPQKAAASRTKPPRKPVVLTSVLEKAKGKLAAGASSSKERKPSAGMQPAAVGNPNGYAYASMGYPPVSQPPHKTPLPGNGQQGFAPMGGSPGFDRQRDRGGNGGNLPPAVHRPWVVVLVILIAAALVTGGIFMVRSAVQKKQLEDAVTPYDATFVPGVYVDGISLANMTPDQARAAVQEQITSRNSAWKVRLTYQGSEVVVITAAMLNMQVDVESVLKDAWLQGHTGTLLERKAAMDRLAVTPYQGYTATPSGDTSKIDTTLQQIQDAVYQQPQDAMMVLFDPNSKDPFQFQPEVAGRRLDIAPLKERLYQMVSTMESGDVEIQPELIQPTVTVAQLKPKYTLLTSVYTPIAKNSTENRTNNIRRSFQPLNGYILAPTRKLSYNQVVGMRTLENGFFEAPEHVYGQLVEGVGGGTCQASTTLYQAAVTAGMEIVKRRPHSLEVSYSERGQDATVYWTRDKEIDLVIRNNTHSDLYFIATVESDPANKSRLVARVAIYGEPLEPGVTYQMDTTQLKVLEPPEPKYIKDTKATYVTYVDQQKSVKAAKEGYEVETFRMKYKDGQLLEMKSLGVDTYPARPEEIYVGVTKR